MTFNPDYAIGHYNNSQPHQTRLLLDLFDFNALYYVFSQKICLKTCLFCICEFHNESIA